MLTKNFSLDELQCKCEDLCPGKKVEAFDTEALYRLQALRDLYNKPMRISSGARCPKHNLSVGGVITSFHVVAPANGVKCKAYDIGTASARERFILVQLAQRLGFTGIGIAETFVHVDTREGEPKLWSYK
jgi:uncharacterized protein YcbK (DUF882 family)